MAKSWYRKKPSRSSKAYTRNWRQRSPTTKHQFSEESIQWQLGYLVPRYDEGYDEGGYGIEAGHGNEEECCWHACGSMEWVWCCGGMCWGQGQGDSGVGDGVGQTTTNDTQEIIGIVTERAPDLVEDMSDSAEIKNVEEEGFESVEDSQDAVTDKSLVDEKTAKEDNGMEKRLVCRDEWECDFCGPECFCWTVEVNA